MSVVLKRISVALIIMLAATLLLYMANSQVSGQGVGSTTEKWFGSAQLINHNPNDGKDNCPNDGNAGKGDDNKGPGGGCKDHPPQGSYGKPPKTP